MKTTPATTPQPVLGYKHNLKSVEPNLPHQYRTIQRQFGIRQRKLWRNFLPHRPATSIPSIKWATTKKLFAPRPKYPHAFSIALKILFSGVRVHNLLRSYQFSVVEDCIESSHLTLRLTALFFEWMHNTRQCAIFILRKDVSFSLNSCFRVIQIHRASWRNSYWSFVFRTALWLFDAGKLFFARIYRPLSDNLYFMNSGYIRGL